jgi:hypothetical protein
MKLLAIALLLAASQQAPNTEFAWDCKVTSAGVCGAASACVGIKPTTSSFIYPSERFYFRCPGHWHDLAECDEYTAVVIASGAYTNIELPGRAAFARVGPGLSFTEMATLMDRVFVYHGQCAVGPPPLVRTKPRS